VKDTLNLIEEKYIDGWLFEIEKRLARTPGYDRYGNQMYDHHIIEYDTRKFWSVYTYKKNSVYFAQINVEYPKKEVIYIKSNNLETLMEKTMQRMLKYEEAFKEWIIYVSS